MPWISSRLRVIPIGSNINARVYRPDEGLKRIVYFGLITPEKGLEEFIECARILRTMRHKGAIAMVGKVPPKHRAYAEQLMNSSHASSVEWLLDRGAEEVSRVLAESALAYLPFPDGASERRGSLKAVCSIGLPCITTKGEDATPALGRAALFASTPADAAECALRLLGELSERRRISQAALDYARSFSWESIARAHIETYLEIQSSRMRAARRLL
jgi:glycosyltransferase involved in cell wall biosynthesis